MLRRSVVGTELLVLRLVSTALNTAGGGEFQPSKAMLLADSRACNGALPQELILKRRILKKSKTPNKSSRNHNTKRN